MKNVEQVVLANLVYNEPYTRKVLPFLKDEYFTNDAQRIVFQQVRGFVEKYNKLPTKTALEIMLDGLSDLTEGEFSEAQEVIETMDSGDESIEWLVETTEKFCRDKAIYNALVESIQIVDGKDKKQNPEAIPKILQDALAVAFDTTIGHDYMDDAESRYEFYHNVENRIPFSLEMFNRITKGGLPNKTLNIILAGTGVGKSLVMCDWAASAVENGKNVLYITMEMAEERIAERIDANLLNVPIDDLAKLSKDEFMLRIKKLRKRTQGKLVVKEYPAGSAHSGHFRAMINELKLKKQFRPDIIFVDYINICASARMKKGNVNSYEYIKAIAEELRALATEFEVPLVSATQTTRNGFNNSDVELTDTSESFGLPATADIMIALISTEELDRMGQYLVKQLKNRYRDPNRDRRFIIGVDKDKMRLYDVEESAQNVMDESHLDQQEEKSGMKPLIYKLSAQDREVPPSLEI